MKIVQNDKSKIVFDMKPGDILLLKMLRYIKRNEKLFVTYGSSHVFPAALHVSKLES